MNELLDSRAADGRPADGRIAAVPDGRRPVGGPRPATPALSLDGLGKSYGPARARHRVLRDIDLTVEGGEFVAIIGFSGGGKTTLMSLLAGLIEPDAGAVHRHGRPIAGPGPDRAIVFQSYSLLPWLTVFGNVELAVRQVRPGLPRGRRREFVERFVAMVGLTPALAKFPRELSGGMRQRVAIARALAMEPDVLLMDEPFGALDALTRANLQQEVLEIWQRTRQTVVMVTNDVAEAVLMADRVLILTPGPGATLDREFAIDLPRPRDRHAFDVDPAALALRERITHRLIELTRSRQEQRAAAIPPRPAIAPRSFDAIWKIG